MTSYAESALYVVHILFVALIATERLVLRQVPLSPLDAGLLMFAGCWFLLLLAGVAAS